MKTIKCISIQNIHVIKTLKQGNIHFASEKKVPDNLITPYRIMSKKYNWDTLPIFAVPDKYIVEMYGARLENSKLLILNIPEDKIKYQCYYDWVDFIYFTEFPGEFDNVFNISFEEFEKLVFFPEEIGKGIACQVTFPYIKPEWVELIIDIPQKIIDDFIGTGGTNFLDLEKMNII